MGKIFLGLKHPQNSGEVCGHVGETGKTQQHKNPDNKEGVVASFLCNVLNQPCRSKC